MRCSTVYHGTALRCTALHSTALHSIARDRAMLNCIAQPSPVQSAVNSEFEDMHVHDSKPPQIDE